MTYPKLIFYGLFKMQEENQKLKIAFVLENYHPKIGGIETLFKSVCERLAQAKHEVTVVTSNADYTQPLEIINGVIVYRISSKSRKKFFFQALPLVLKHAKDADIIHTTSYTAGLPAFLVAKWLRKKILITFHEYRGKYWYELPAMSFSSKFQRWLLEALLVRLPFDKFIAVSFYTENRLLQSGVADEKVEVIYNGIDYQDYVQFGMEKKKKYDFIYFGRLANSKGIELLLPSFDKILAQYNHAKVAIAYGSSKPNIEMSLKRWYENNKNKNRISIFYQIDFDELMNLISSSKAVVIPSLMEGFCFAAVEAMAVGTPIVSSGQWALAEVVNAKHITMKEYSVQGLTNALNRALNGDWDWKPKQKFELANTTQSYIKLYNELMKEE